MSADQKRPTKFARRSFGVVLALSPLALLLASIGTGVARTQQAHFAGAGFMIAAFTVGVINFYLSFIRPRLFLRRRGSMENYRNDSGLPMIGTVLLTIGGLFGFGAIGSALIGVAAFALDTGGSFWFLVSTWRDRSFWDI